MRITGGAARGIPLKVPAGDAVRPATDALRQAVFSSLAARVPAARFLDLFAGSGAYGLEALSRGASAGTFIEQHAKTAACLRDNLAAVRKSLGAAGAGGGSSDSGGPDVLLHEADAVRGAWPAQPPDLVFIDPPYDQIGSVAPELFQRLLAEYPAAADMIVVFEAPGEARLEPPGWTCRKRLGKGSRQPTASIFLRAAK